MITKKDVQHLTVDPDGHVNIPGWFNTDEFWQYTDGAWRFSREALLDKVAELDKSKYNELVAALVASSRLSKRGEE